MSTVINPALLQQQKSLQQQISAAVGQQGYAALATPAIKAKSVALGAVNNVIGFLKNHIF